MQTVADFLVRGMGLELPLELEKHVWRELDTTCAITGEHITEGIPWDKVIPSSTGEYLDLLHGMAFSYISLAAAAAFKGSWNMGSRLIFEDGTHYHPLISADSAATELLWPSAPALCGWTPPYWKPSIFMQGWKAGTFVSPFDKGDAFDLSFVA